MASNSRREAQGQHGDDDQRQARRDERRQIHVGGSAAAHVGGYAGTGGAGDHRTAKPSHQGRGLGVAGRVVAMTFEDGRVAALVDGRRRHQGHAMRACPGRPAGWDHARVCAARVAARLGELLGELVLKLLGLVGLLPGAVCRCCLKLSALTLQRRGRTLWSASPCACSDAA